MKKLLAVLFALIFFVPVIAHAEPAPAANAACKKTCPQIIVVKSNCNGAESRPLTPAELQNNKDAAVCETKCNCETWPEMRQNYYNIGDKVCDQYPVSQ